MARPSYNHRLVASVLYRFPWLYDTFSPLLGLDQLRQRVAELASPQPGDRVLDACCGTGSLALRLLATMEYRGEVAGVDISPYMLRRARQKGGNKVSFILGNAEAMPFPNEYFDRGTITLALHEMPSLNRGRVLRELRRVTREGGRLVLAELYPPRGLVGRLFVSLFEVWELVEEMEGLRQELAGSGFQVTYEERRGRLFQILVAKG